MESVCKKLGRSHPIVAQSKKEFAAGHALLDGSIMPNDSSISLPVRATKGLIPRAHICFNSIIKELDRRQYTYSYHFRAFNVKIKNRNIDFRIYEGQKKTKDGTLKYTGQLVLFIDECFADNCRKYWRDGEKQKIEFLGKEIVDEIIKIGNYVYKKHLKNTIRWNRKRRLEKLAIKRREHFYNLKNNEKYEIEKFNNHAKAWENANRIRRYLEYLESLSDQIKSIKGENIVGYIQKGYDIADRIDPTIKSKRSILDLALPDKIFQRPWEEINNDIIKYLSEEIHTIKA